MLNAHGVHVLLVTEKSLDFFQFKFMLQEIIHTLSFQHWFEFMSNTVSYEVIEFQNV